MGAAATAAVVGGSFLFKPHPVGNASVPEPAKPVDLQRYLGVWFEIARYNQRFERSCAGGVTATYSLRADESIDVVNRCRESDGSTKEAHGRAKIVDRVTNAKIKVNFFGPFYGDYWILDHADDYSWSIAGEPSGRYLWILSRASNPGETVIKELVRRAQGLGYDTRLLIYTEQP
ncbi:MAG: lipocalin family protein [Sphingomicrobium sp.]